MTGPRSERDERRDPVDIRSVTEDRLADLAALFESHGSTGGCWCMAQIATNREYHAGWYGQNRARFEQLTRESPMPMGLLAYSAAVPVGWCAAGPRSRFERAIGPRNTMLKGRDPSEDDDVWLLPCFFVRVGHRRSGTTRRLLAAAVDLARSYGATALEAFPLADDNPAKTDYYGRERQFALQGFTCIARPTPKRALMRLDLSPPTRD